MVKYLSVSGVAPSSISRRVMLGDSMKNSFVSRDYHHGKPYQPRLWKMMFLWEKFFFSGHNLLDFRTVKVSLRSSKFFVMPCKGAQLGKNFGNPTCHNHPRFTNSTGNRIWNMDEYGLHGFHWWEMMIWWYGKGWLLRKGWHSNFFSGWKLPQNPTHFEAGGSARTIFVRALNCRISLDGVLGNQIDQAKQTNVQLVTIGLPDIRWYNW